MFMKWLFGGLVLLLVLISFGCDPCRRMAKSKMVELKDSAAFCYYKKKNFETASVMFEELKAIYRADVRLEKISFYYAFSKYYMGQNIMAAYYFREFGQMFPSSKYTEEANFMVGKSYYRTANEYTLDQTETHKAIEYLQLYLLQYPLGQWTDQTKEMLAEMKDRLAKKAFHQANLYYKIYQFHSGVLAFKSMLAEYPDCKYREEAHFKLFLCAALYAQYSIVDKREERYLESLAYYEKFIDKYPNSKWAPIAEKQFVKIQSELQKIRQKNSSYLNKQ